MTPSEDNNFSYYRETGDGRYVAVIPRMFNSIVLIGEIRDTCGYDSHWCYDTTDQAIAGAKTWNPLTEKEPDGWFRHAASGRRRPGGDKTKEYINP